MQCCDIISNHFYWKFIVAQDLKGAAGFGGKLKTSKLGNCGPELHRLRYRIFSQLAMWSNGCRGDAFFSSTPLKAPPCPQRLIVVVALHLETVAVLTLPGSGAVFFKPITTRIPRFTSWGRGSVRRHINQMRKGCNTMQQAKVCDDPSSIVYHLSGLQYKEFPTALSNTYI